MIHFQSATAYICLHASSLYILVRFCWNFNEIELPEKKRRKLLEKPKISYGKHLKKKQNNVGP